MSIAFCPIQRTSLESQMVKHLPTMRETRVQSLGQKNALKKEMAIHSSTLAWKVLWMEEPGGLQSMGPQRVRHDWATSLHFCPIAVGPCCVSIVYIAVCIVTFLATWMDLESIRLSGERQTSYDIPYMWNLKKWPIQNRNKYTDIESRCMVTRGDRCREEA